MLTRSSFARQRIQSSVLALIALGVIIGVLVWLPTQFLLHTERLSAFNQLDEDFERLNSSLLLLRNLEGRYYQRESDQAFDQFDKAYGQLRENLRKVPIKRQSLNDSQALLLALDNYRKLLAELDAMNRTYGRTPETGVYGELRAASHRLEDLLSSNSDLTVALLQLRRAEKDFQLRGDEESLQRFQQYQALVSQQLPQQLSEAEGLLAADAEFQRYLQLHQSLVDIELLRRDTSEKIAASVGQLDQLQLTLLNHVPRLQIRYHRLVPPAHSWLLRLREIAVAVDAYPELTLPLFDALHRRHSKHHS